MARPISLTATAAATNTTTTTTITMLLLVAFSALIPTTNSLCSDSMAATLSSSGFTLFAHALHSGNLTTTTPRTYLAPPDTAFLNRPLDARTLQAHISAAGALAYQSLLTLPHNSTLPTLHHNTTLIVGTDGKRVSFNDVLVVIPNLYVDGSCAVHGVDGPLVPTPSLVDPQDVSRPRKERKQSPVVSPRRRANQFATYARFIRRAHRPKHAHENGESRLP